MNRINIIKSIGEENIGIENLENLLNNKPKVYAYDGFEPSGRMHIAQGLLRANNVNKFVEAGVYFKFWVADWFALMNLKLGGDIKKIKKAGEDMILMWKACNMNIDKLDADGKPMIEFIWSSEEINRRSDEYWKLVLDIATRFTLTHIKKCTTIMGKKEEKNVFDKIVELNTNITTFFDNLDKNKMEENSEYSDSKNKILDILKTLLESNKDELSASQIFYPVMQCADIFFLGIDICSLGIDQKKVNMLAIDYCEKIKRKFKPIIISHHMLNGLDGSDKMSKSNPDNTIFMDDTVLEIKRKIKKAFCEPQNIEKNPLLDWIEHLILKINPNIMIMTRNSEGLEVDKTYENINEIKDEFQKDNIHPKNLKNSVANVLIEMLTPIQTRFQELKKLTKN